MVNRLETNASANDLVGLLELWNDFKDYSKILNFASSLGWTENDIRQGYIFMGETLLRAILDELMWCEFIDLKSSYELYRAKHRGIHLSKISNSCERIKFIRGYYRSIQKFKRSQNRQQLLRNRKIFDAFFSNFSRIFYSSIKKSVDFNFSDADRKLLCKLSKILFDLVQTHANTPDGRYFALFQNYCSGQELEKSLAGYKVTLAYLLQSSLSANDFAKVKDISGAVDWSIEYYEHKYIQAHPRKFKRKGLDFLSQISIKIPGKTVDDYFTDLNDNIIQPIEKAKKTRIALDVYYLFTKKISKNIFKPLFSEERPQLSKEDIKDELFFWYPCEVIDSARHHIFNGATAFIIVLEGAVRWYQRMGSRSPVYVLKIPHTVGDNQHNYSYGVLIESKGTFGSDWSGWMMFYDICGDYSGFSGQEHAYVEGVINIHKKSEAISLRELNIPQEELKSYLELKCTTHEISKTAPAHNKRKEILQEARALVVELVVYYLQSQIKNRSVEWGFENKKDGDIDITVESKRSLKLIECKLTPSSLQIKEQIKKLQNKARNLTTKKRKILEFWFWFEPNPVVIQELRSKHIQYHIVSRELRKQPNFAKRHDKLNLVLNSDDPEGTDNYDWEE